MNTARSSQATPMSIVTQTRVHPDHAVDFARWQMEVNDAIAQAEGYLDGQVIPPSPPVQLDWVIVQRFDSQESARHWLQSPERARLLASARPWLVGVDDVHLIADETRTQVPVSAVIATNIQPGDEQRFLEWQQRIAVAQSRAPGFQGYKLQPPAPGVHEDWVTVLRFDSEANLETWLTSPERQRLLAESASFTGDSHVRTVRSGFDAWFPVDRGSAPRPPWKQNMTVLLALYPVVFVFGKLVGDPVFTDWLDLPFWFSLFLSNAASVIILSYLVPRISVRLKWWLEPTTDTRRANIAGAVLIVILYGVLLSAFSFW